MATSTTKRTELVMAEYPTEQGYTDQAIAQHTEFGAELLVQRLDRSRTPLMLLSRWTIPADQMDRIADWWKGTNTNAAA